jgi:hypothetical protein
MKQPPMMAAAIPLSFISPPYNLKPMDDETHCKLKIVGIKNIRH